MSGRDTSDEVEQTSQETPSEAAEDHTRTPKSVMFTFRLPQEELTTIKQAAAAEGMPLSEYLRKAATSRSESATPTQLQYGYMVGTAYAQSGSLATWSDASPQVSAESERASKDATKQAEAETEIQRESRSK